MIHWSGRLQGAPAAMTGPYSARNASAVRMRTGPQWRWHVDEVFVKINGERHYLWRAVDHEGEVLEAYVSKGRDRRAALKFLRKSVKRYGRPEAIVTDRLFSRSRPSTPSCMNRSCQRQTQVFDLAVAAMHRTNISG
jgi:transposase-like protein